MGLGWLDTPARYGLVTRAIHWGMALLLAWQFTGMVLRLILGRTPLMAFWVGSHASVGTLLLALVLFRALWMWINRRHRPPHHHGLMGRLSLIGHGALYALMIIVPALALLRAFGSGRGFAFFGWQIVERGGARIEWMVAPASTLHSPLAWTLLALIFGHAAMALIHHFRWKDGTLKRMA